FPSLCRAISRIVFTDSCWALSINEQVLTTMTSASSARGTSSAPASANMPIMTSLSTRFFGHPRLTNPTLGAAVLGWYSPGCCAGSFSRVSTGENFGDMQSDYFISSDYQLVCRILPSDFGCPVLVACISRQGGDFDFDSRIASL